ncbi:MAG: NAD(P)/FAD-dependent oxidoreductase [Bradymonadales bacterium]|nr:MAG: NAD(P)/FAD-dependent oxidoreductase [Bradymonadales bacterium]
MKRQHDFVIVGGGFTGLSAAYDLSRKGFSVVVLEADSGVGGLASAFQVKGERLDKFYHHWFTNDEAVMKLVTELDLLDQVEIHPTRTGVYYANNFFRLSTPMDLLNFRPLSFFNRIRLGLLAVRARRIKNWQPLEALSAEEWLRDLGGESVYRVVWEPLLKGKFGAAASQISAVWFWNKLKLRGGSRGKGGEERLAYLKGGFVRLAECLQDRILSAGGEVKTDHSVQSIRPQVGEEAWSVKTNHGDFIASNVICTTALPLISKMISEWATAEYQRSLNRIQYLANLCLVLELDRSLSNTYWLNVNDPNFPFVGVIEHTNFEKASTYGGRHIVYLSKYLPHTDELYQMSKDEILEFTLPHLQRMFPEFSRDWIQDFHLWKARWAQPIVEKRYSSLIPSTQGPLKGFYVCSMAQIYPEDRGTNYAIREGRALAKQLASETELQAAHAEPAEAALG